VITIPLFSAIVGVSLAIVVYNKVVLVQPAPNHLFVALFVDFIVQLFLFGHFVRGQACLAGSTQSPQLC
jgi:hypothetical protein